jgi:pimeloyl-ACP methyl ester carboxylesterase
LVKDQTRATQLAWLGHSMGGNVMLAYLARYGQDAAIARLVTVGSQVTMPRGQLVGEFMIEYLRHRQMEVAGRRPDPQQLMQNTKHLFFNERNADAGIVRALDTVAQDTPSTGVIMQYMDLSSSGKLHDAKKSTNYAAGLSNVRCPYLILGGSADQIAPPDAQAYLHTNVGSADRTLVILGRRSGFSVEYGHNDSLVSPAARQEVYPLIARWLAGQAITSR